MLHAMMEPLRQRLVQEMITLAGKFLHHQKLLIDENEKIRDDLGPVGFALSLEPQMKFHPVQHEHVMLKRITCNERAVGQFMKILRNEPVRGANRSLHNRLHSAGHLVIIRQFQFEFTRSEEHTSKLQSHSFISYA